MEAAAFDRIIIIIISNMDFMHTASCAILVIPVAMVARAQLEAG